MKKLYLILLFLFVLIWGWPVATSSAQAQLPPTVQVSQNSASPNFPDNIGFDFKAKVASGSPTFKKLEFSFRLVGDVATSVRLINFERGTGQEISANTSIDTQKDYIPPGSRLSYFWTLYDEAGTAYATRTQELIYNDARFKFRELKSGIVTVRWYQGDDNFGKATLNKALATIDKLGKLYKLEPKNPINITIYPDSRTMFTALPPNTAEWVGGQAFPSLGTIVLSIAPGNLTEIGRSVPHEVSHQVIYQATVNPYNGPPRWLDEGLAVSNQDQVEGILQETFERGVDKRTLYPLRVLNGSFPADGQESYLAYGQSVKVVQYILSKYGQDAMTKILSAFREGVTYDDAIRRGIGIGLDDLDREWKQSINYPVPALVAATPATPTIGFTPIPITPLKTASATTAVAASNTAAPSTATAIPATTRPPDPTIATAPTGRAAPSLAPTPSAQSGTNSASSGSLLLFAGLAALLVVGGGIGLVLFRRGGKG